MAILKKTSLSYGFTITILILHLIFLPDCSPNFESQSLVNKFRILAIKAQPPEGHSGDEIYLRPLLSKTKSGISPLLIWLACTPHQGQSGIQCLEEEGGSLIASGDEVIFRLPELTDDQKEEKVDIYIVLLACAGALQIPDFEKGIYNFCDGDESDMAIKTVSVVRETKNSNPVIESIEIKKSNGVPLELNGNGNYVLHCTEKCEEEKLILTLKLAEGSQELYNQKKVNGEVTLLEDIFISWFVTNGKLHHSRSYESNYSTLSDPSSARKQLIYENTWTPPSKDETVEFYFVAYDQRGGVDFTPPIVLNVTSGEK